MLSMTLSFENDLCVFLMCVLFLQSYTSFMLVLYVSYNKHFSKIIDALLAYSDSFKELAQIFNKSNLSCSENCSNIKE